MGPSVVLALKFGASSLIRNDIVGLLQSLRHQFQGDLVMSNTIGEGVL
jgi:hypothetical protein